MCTPILIASAALAVGSAIAHTVANNQQQNARNDVLAAERIRQHGFDAEIQPLQDESRDRYVDFVPQMEQKAASLGDYLGSRVDDPNASAGSDLPSSSSALVNREIVNQKDKAQHYVDQQTGALANMQSFGDLLGDISIGQARDASKIGQLGGFKASSVGLVPMELDNSQHAGDFANFLGDILGGVSNVGVSAGIYPQNSISRFFGIDPLTQAKSVAGGALTVT